ncbi:GIY-YIG nuclease family protein [Frigidibacter sp. MR17.24]|uniref:GIY-YIG nuclease family protein n=1 Tax=Frigidibacter sp. MR17.24 TaxID=3127345 RepID=UPI0030130814
MKHLVGPLEVIPPEAAFRAVLGPHLVTLPRLAPLADPGIYVVALAPGADIPGLCARPGEILYVGMSRKSLAARHHLRYRHSGGSTLRRSLGALLVDALALAPVPRDSAGDTPAQYRFRDDGERRLSGWMQDHLLGAQFPCDGNLPEIEAALIRLIRPPLNLTGWRNPQRGHVMAMRRRCAQAAQEARGRLA